MKKQKPRGYFQKWSNVKRKLQRIIEEEGCLPGQIVLIRLGHCDVSTAIYRYHGGYASVREKLQQEGILPSDQDQLEQLVEAYVRQ